MITPSASAQARLTSVRAFVSSFAEQPWVKVRWRDFAVYAFFALLLPIAWGIVLAVRWPNYADYLLESDIARAALERADPSLPTAYLVGVFVFGLGLSCLGLAVQASVSRMRVVKAGFIFGYAYSIVGTGMSLVVASSSLALAIVPSLTLFLLALLSVFAMPATRSCFTLRFDIRREGLFLGATLALFCLTLLLSYLGGLTVSNSVNQRLIDAGSQDLSIGLIWFQAVFTAPFIEEFLVRRPMFASSPNPFVGYLCASLLFGAVHVQSYGDWQSLGAYLLPSLGLSLGLLLLRQTMPGVFAHSFVNMVSVIT